MIGKLTGTLTDKHPPEVIIDCHGVGYEVQVPMSTFYNLPAEGQKVSLLTHFVVREDAQILYGFGSAKEREAFRELIKISGVVPRTALSVLFMGLFAQAPWLFLLVMSVILRLQIISTYQLLIFSKDKIFQKLLLQKKADSNYKILIS